VSRKTYAGVVKEWFKSPAWAAFARQLLPKRGSGLPKTQRNQALWAGMAAAHRFAVTDQKGSGRPMDNTLLVSLSQQLASYRSMDVIANNMANMSTPAYKRESMKFEEYVQQSRPAEGETGTQRISFVQDKGTLRDLTQGALTHTGAPFDLAISGKGYFTIQTPNGDTRYTRNGHFTLDGNGQIVTEGGGVLQADGGPVQITNDDGDIHIAQDGTITGARGQLGKLKLVTFNDEAALKKEGASLYSTTQQPNAVETPVIVQGSLEESNVQPVLEISHMLDVMRAYQTTANLTQSQEELKRNAIDKLGNVAN
jgi:flagellar basal-body rod protein FlgF